MSGAVQEYLGCYFYRVSVLKMQIHGRLLSKSSMQQSTIVDQDVQQSYQMELEAWLLDWKSEMSSTVESSQMHDPQLSSVLDAWASLHYHHATLMVDQIHQTGSYTAHQHCDKLVRACNFLIKQQRKSPLLRLATPRPNQSILPVYLKDWTVPHLVFSAGLELLVQRGRGGGSIPEALRTARHCVTTLALVESDASMLSTGFSEILEGLCDSAETKGD